MRRKFTRVRAEEFKEWVRRRAKHREFTEKEYGVDLENWQRERGGSATEINEFCLVLPLGRDVCLKIYTSIDRETRISRDRGEDSIKIVVATESTLEPIRERITHTYRTDNWQANLDNNLIEALEKLYGSENIECPDAKCRGKLILWRNREKDQTFLGCIKGRDCGRNKSLARMDFAGSRR